MPKLIHFTQIKVYTDLLQNRCYEFTLSSGFNLLQIVFQVLR